MGELTCTPWRRYGRDRVYVARGPARLGYLDRTTDVKQQPPDVTIVARRQVVRWLRDRPVVLDAAAVDRLARVVRDPRTWSVE